MTRRFEKHIGTFIETQVLGERPVRGLNLSADLQGLHHTAQRINSVKITRGGKVDRLATKREREEMRESFYRPLRILKRKLPDEIIDRVGYRVIDDGSVRLLVDNQPYDPSKTYNF
jgi:hypothetical protein